MALIEDGTPVHGGMIEGGQPPTFRRRKVVTSAQVKALHATPVEIVPAPGAGLALIFEGAVVQKPAGTAYTGVAAGDDLTITYTNAAGLEVGRVETTGFMDQATAQLRWCYGFRAASGISITPVANAALMISLLGDAITTGNRPLNMEIHYRVVDAAP